MFNQRKTNSYDLVGTNARNSECSIATNQGHLYGENMIGRMSLEKSDMGRNSNFEQVNSPPSY